MEGLTLLQRAQRAGLAVLAEGDKLVIRGPKRAEPVARLLIERKPAVMAALARKGLCKGGAAAQWRDCYAARVAHWFMHGRRDWYDAELLAFGELLRAWHRQYGAPSLPSRCVGCGDDLAADAGLTVDRDGARVHFDAVRGVDCLIAFGQQWRSAAVAGLRARGVEAPNGFELL